MTTRCLPRTFSCHDGLRAVGSWLDVRGNRGIRITEEDDALVVEAATSPLCLSLPVEVFRFDAARMMRLREAALNDRGAPRSYPSHGGVDSDRL
jgi:hypothetical protein